MTSSGRVSRDPQPKRKGSSIAKSQSVVVCGAGAAGIAAAIASARCGVPTLLLDVNPKPGGTVVHSLIHTLAGLHNSSGELLNQGLAAELVRRLQEADPAATRRQMGQLYVLNVAPTTYGSVTAAWLRSEPSLNLIWSSRVVDVRSHGKQVRQVKIQNTDRTTWQNVRAVIDTTGDAGLISLIDPGAVDRGGRQTAGGWIVRLRGVARDTLKFPRSVGVVRALRQASSDGQLPPSCQHLWVDTGTASDDAYLKFFIPLTGRCFADDGRLTHVVAEYREILNTVLDVLRGFPGFASVVVEDIGQIGLRDAPQIKGDYQLTVEDVRQGRTFPDGVCRAAWPIEFWHPVDGIQLEMLPTDHSYEIPLRSLTLRGWRNVWMAGKSLSADQLAQASARVVGTCWAMGEAVGQAAAMTTGSLASDVEVIKNAT